MLIDLWLLRSRPDQVHHVTLNGDASKGYYRLDLKKDFNNCEDSSACILPQVLIL